MKPVRNEPFPREPRGPLFLFSIDRNGLCAKIPVMNWRQRIRDWGITLALFALGAQLSVAAALAVPAGPEAAPGRFFAAAICHQNGPEGGAGSHQHDCALCPLCHVVSAAEHALPASTPALLLPRLAAGITVSLPAIRAPPAPSLSPFQARAPPLAV
jgi:hypothetical protein